MDGCPQDTYIHGLRLEGYTYTYLRESLGRVPEAVFFAECGQIRRMCLRQISFLIVVRTHAYIHTHTCIHTCIQTHTHMHAYTHGRNNTYTSLVD